MVDFLVIRSLYLVYLSCGIADFTLLARAEQNSSVVYKPPRSRIELFYELAKKKIKFDSSEGLFANLVLLKRFGKIGSWVLTI